MYFSFRNKNAFDNSPSNERRRSSRKREDKSYVESPDIVIEEDYISKPSPAKKPNLGGGLGDLRGGLGGGVGGGQGYGGVKEPSLGGREKTEVEQIKKPGQTNGIEMESDEDTEDENLPPVPSVQVLTILRGLESIFRLQNF